MNLLVDANLSPKVAKQLREAGHDATHVVEHGLLAAADEEIAVYAAEHGKVIISADSDFATLLAFSGHTTPSLVLFRSADRLTPQEQASVLVANLGAVEEELVAGAVVSIARGHMRVRRLPLR